MSHDWPNEIHKYGDTVALLRRKPFFREDIDKGELGKYCRLYESFYFGIALYIRHPIHYDLK